MLIANRAVETDRIKDANHKPPIQGLVNNGAQPALSKAGTSMGGSPCALAIAL